MDSLALNTTEEGISEFGERNRNPSTMQQLQKGNTHNGNTRRRKEKKIRKKYLKQY